jgi:hypothetical protein
MSYDLQLFKPCPGEDPLVTAQRDQETVPFLPPTPEDWALQRRIADALVAHNPKLQVGQYGGDKPIPPENESVVKARLAYPHLELNGPDDDPTGIQITRCYDQA